MEYKVLENGNLQNYLNIFQKKINYDKLLKLKDIIIDIYKNTRI